MVELGAGRGEMAEAFSRVALHPDRDRCRRTAGTFRGVVFSNEFFDALPVDVAIFRGGDFREQRVALRDGRFVWRDRRRGVGGERPITCARYFPPPEEGRWYEANLAALDWMERIAGALERGYVLTIDYGYTRARSRARFPRAR